VESVLSVRYFTAYSGIKFPLKLVNELDNASLQRRITYFKGYYQDNGLILKLEKVVYGEVEFTHQYDYYPDGTLRKLMLIEGEEKPRILLFDRQGNAIESRDEEAQ